MNIVLLSGGSGKRLWPLSNDKRSKQFIKILKNEHGKLESMIQRVYKQIKNIDKNSNITIAASITQADDIRNQLGNDIDISVEPCRRDTFPAIALVTAYLVDIKKIDPEESVIVCPVDPYVEKEYFEALKELSHHVDNNEANLLLMGIKPTYPCEKYGYIIPKSNDKISMVSSFKEKPTVEIAKKYIKQHALWNSGVFAYKLKYVLQKAHELIDFKDYHDLFSKYETLKKISFDYEVVEKENNIKVQRFEGHWKDLGTWNTLTETMDKPVIGNAFLNEGCSDVRIINELDIPVLAMGLDKIVISATKNGILVSDLEQSTYIKPFVEKVEYQNINLKNIENDKSKIIDVDEDSKTSKISIDLNQTLKYTPQKNYDEILIIVQGKGISIEDNTEKLIKVGDIITIKDNRELIVKALTQMKLINVKLKKAEYMYNVYEVYNTREKECINS